MRSGLVAADGWQARPGQRSLLRDRLLDPAELEAKLSHSGVMACRSILLRILEAARKERLIATNPVRRSRPPNRAWTPTGSSATSCDEPSPPRRSATSWPPAGPSTATPS